MHTAPLWIACDILCLIILIQSFLYKVDGDELLASRTGLIEFAWNLVCRERQEDSFIAWSGVLSQRGLEH
jgi:hypothetical protein